MLHMIHRPVVPTSLYQHRVVCELWLQTGVEKTAGMTFHLTALVSFHQPRHGAMRSRGYHYPGIIVVLVVTTSGLSMAILIEDHC